jgi:nucleoside-diphosphate-sugar epimerase
MFLSSGEVYGDGSGIHENADFKPRSFYATTKSQAEALLRYFVNCFDIKIVRVFFPFGRDFPEGHIFEVYDAIKRGGSIDTPYHMISPSYVDDIADPLLRLAGIKGHQMLNICGAPIKVEGFIDLVKHACGGQPKKISIGSKQLTGSSEKAQELGFRETPLKEALMRSFGDRA